jgi:glycerol-3-phosphate dehydrogenase
MTTPTPDISDVVVIGAGIVGARDRPRPGRHRPVLTLVDAEATSVTAPARPTPRCCTPGTTPPPAPESRLVARSYELLGLRRADRHSHRRTGALLVAWTDEEVTPCLA